MVRQHFSLFVVCVSLLIVCFTLSIVLGRAFSKANEAIIVQSEPQGDKQLTFEAKVEITIDRTKAAHCGINTGDLVSVLQKQLAKKSFQLEDIYNLEVRSDPTITEGRTYRVDQFIQVKVTLIRPEQIKKQGHREK